MKYFVTISFLLIFTSFLFGTTYHTITIDGNNDFDTATEQFTTTSGTSLLAYITWDANYIYFGFSGNSPAGPVTDASRNYHIYIDTDPQLNPKSGNGTIYGESWRWNPTLPFNADYHYAFKTSDLGVFKRYYNGSSWTDATFNESNWKGSGFWEVAINLNDIGNPSQIYVLMYVEEDWDGGYICGGNPNNLFTNITSPAHGTSITFNDHWLGFNLVSGVNPNDSGNNDQSLPVTLNSFTAQYSQNAIILQWITKSEVDVLGYEVQRATNQAGPFQTIASYQDHSELRAVGNTSAQTVYSFEDQTVSPGVTYWYKLISHDLDGSQQTFGPVSATLQNNNDPLQPVSGNIPDQFELKQNFPNPFNNSTEIVFTLPQEQNQVQLKIYDLNGKLIKTLVNSDLGAGKYQLRWNGDDNLGHLVPSGVYIYQLSTPQFVHSKKMLLIQ